MGKDISVIIPVFNAASTIKISLESLSKQTVKVKEIIFIDNKSQDNSIDLIKDYKKETKEFTIVLLRQKQTQSVASSYNMALKNAKGKYIVAMHSDSSLPTTKELQKLIAPILNDSHVVATYSYVTLPEDIWLGYPFWEKCQSARVVGKKIPGLNGKFDCYRKDALLKLHGFDDVNFDRFSDGSDADIHYRLKTIGRVVLTDSEVVHLHKLTHEYSFFQWLEKRKNMSITAGRLLKMYLLKTDVKGIASFLARPIIALLPFMFPTMGLVVVVAYGFLYTPKLFTNASTLKDPRIIVLPFINMFLIYFESFWIFFTFFTHKVKTKTSL